MSVVTKPSPTLVGAPRLPRRETVVGHVVGLALAIAGVGMVASAVVEKIDGGPDAVMFVASGLLVGVPGFALWNRTAPPHRIPAGAIFAAVLSAWIAFALCATVPYLASGTLVRFDLALFEAVSGLTTTSATILGPPEGLGAGLLFWRAATQWIGGIGVVVFAVSVLPFLGAGGMELAHSAALGVAAERLAPRVRATARRLVPLYLGFTALVALGYAAFGMSAFDAVTYSFTTVSTGGFSHNNAFVLSPGAQWVAVVAMFFAGGSLALYWRALRGKPLVIFRSVEFRAYLVITVLICLAALLQIPGVFRHPDPEVVRRVIFTTVSITSTTGYLANDIGAWQVPVQLLLVFAMGLGGMAGSSAGGFKVFRLLAVLGYARRQLYGQLHPRAVAIVRFGHDVVPELVLTRVLGFFGLFMAIGAVGTLLLAVFGADMRTAISAAASALGNVGPPLTAFGPGQEFLDVTFGARIVVMVLMLVGRLEIFPVLLGVVPFMRFVGDRLPRRGAQQLVRFFRG